MPGQRQERFVRRPRRLFGGIPLLALQRERWIRRLGRHREDEMPGRANRHDLAVAQRPAAHIVDADELGDALLQARHVFGVPHRRFLVIEPLAPVAADLRIAAQKVGLVLDDARVVVPFAVDGIHQQHVVRKRLGEATHEVVEEAVAPVAVGLDALGDIIQIVGIIFGDGEVAFVVAAAIVITDEFFDVRDFLEQLGKVGTVFLPLLPMRMVVGPHREEFADVGELRQVISQNLIEKEQIGF